MNIIRKIIVLFTIFIISYQKIFRESITLSKFKKEGGFHYISKMAMDIGHGSWSIRARYNKRVNIPEGTEQNKPLFSQLYIFLDDEWDALDHNDSCNDKIQEQRTHKSVKEVNIPVDSDWSAVRSGTVAQSRRRRVWFFVLADCEMERIQNLFNANKHVGVKIEIELTLINNKSHFGSDESGFIAPIIFLLIITSGAFVYGLMHSIKDSNKGEDFDWGLFLILLAIGFQAAFLFFELIHQITYSSNGRGVFALELLGDLCEILSSFTVSCFLLLVSWGWTINYMELDSFDILIPLGVLVGVIHMMIMGLGKLTDNAHYKYHQYDGWVGYLVLFLRIGIFIYFAYGIKDTLKKASLKLQQFVKSFALMGSAYLLAFPLLLIISYFIAPYVRNIVITLGTLLIQTIAFVVLIYLSTNKKSGYYQVSMKSQTILPSNKLF